MRRWLVDDTVVHTADLDAEERDWFSRRLRTDDGGPLAEAFGLAVERRAEGAAFVVDDESYRYPSELGDTYFPRNGVPGLAALLLADHVSLYGQVWAPGDDGPGPGWHAMDREQVAAELAEIAAAQRVGKGGWPEQYATDVPRLLAEAETLLAAVGLLRRLGRQWWLSPAVGRWDAPPNSAYSAAPIEAAANPEVPETTLLDLEGF